MLDNVSHDFLFWLEKCEKEKGSSILLFCLELIATRRNAARNSLINGMKKLQFELLLYFRQTTKCQISSNKKPINCLHFFDVLIEKSSTSFITSTYKKPTHTDLYSNGRVSFRCTGNEILSPFYSTALMTSPVPTNWFTRNIWMSSECYLATVAPTIFWTVAFSNLKHKTRCHTTTYGRNSAVL